MRIAVPIWRDRVSPVFDTAETLLVVEADGGREVSRRRIDLSDNPPQDRVKRLTAAGVDALLCGAISRPLFDMLIAAGVDVTPFLSGEVEALLRTTVERGVIDPRYLMPGCGGWGRRRRLRRRNGTGRGKVTI